MCVCLCMRVCVGVYWVGGVATMGGGRPKIAHTVHTLWDLALNVCYFPRFVSSFHLSLCVCVYYFVFKIVCVFEWVFLSDIVN